LGTCHWPLQTALSGSIIKAPGFAGGYLLEQSPKLCCEEAGTDMFIYDELVWSPH
jgi:hypothetical protein